MSNDHNAAGCLLAIGVLVLGGCDRVFGLGDVGLPTRLRFSNQDSLTDLTQFPVLVTLDASVIDYAIVADPTKELRFLDPATLEELPFEVDHWDPMGSSALWVRVNKIRGGSGSDEILMESGPEIALAAPAPAAVWADGFALVSHFQRDTVAGLVTDTLGMASGEPTKTTIVGGQIGAGLGLDRMSSVTFMNSETLIDGWDQVTLELWIATAEDVTESRVFSKYDAFTGCRILTGGDLQCDIQYEGNVETTYARDAVVTSGGEPAWHYIVYSSDGTQMQLYRDGVARGPWPAGRMSIGPGDPLVLGNDQSPTTFSGSLDEVRISRVARSADWVYAQYQAMTGQFVRFR